MASSFLCVNTNGDLEIWTERSRYILSEYTEYESEPEIDTKVIIRTCRFHGVEYFVEYFNYENNKVQTALLDDDPHNYGRVVFESWSDEPSKTNYYQDENIKYI